jgi:hypothetical protein
MAVTQQWWRPGSFFFREGAPLLDIFAGLLAEKEVGEEEEEDILMRLQNLIIAKGSIKVAKSG